MSRPKITILTQHHYDTRFVEQGMHDLDYDKNICVCTSEGKIIEAVKGADLIVNLGHPMPRKIIESIDKASAIVSVGQGFNHIDIDAATQQNMMVVNSAGYVTENVSNHTMALLLALSRKLTIADKLVRNGEWQGNLHIRKNLLPMPTIEGQTLGIVGLGNIARATARKAKVFGLRVLAYDIYVQPWIAKEYQAELVSSLEALASRSDFVAVLVPLNNETSGMIDRSFFKAMKTTAYLINTSRGKVVDEDALIKAIQKNEIAGAGIDVFDQEPTPLNNPILKLENVIVSPHSAGSSDSADSDGLVQIGEEAARILKGMWPLSLVNPEVKARIPARRLATN